MQMIVAIIGVVMISLAISALVIGGGYWAGISLYRYARRSLHTRPLTSEESWAESAEEAMDESRWAGLVALPPTTPTDHV